MDQKCTNDRQVSVQDLDDNVDENLAWLTQKAEDPKSNKGNLRLQFVDTLFIARLRPNMSVHRVVIIIIF